MNGNIFNGQQNVNGFYPYNYSAAMQSMGRPEPTAYIMPQAPQAAMIKGRPVSSFEEARVAQVDLDGSISIFPDLGNKKIYTKRINADGTAALSVFVLEETPSEQITAYATRDEVAQLKATLDDILSKLKGSNGTPVNSTQQTKINF